MKIFLENLRNNAEKRIIPIIGLQTEELLREQLLLHKPKLLVEVGSAIWYSTIFLASLMRERGGNVVSFEISYPAYLEALLHIKEAGLGNITLYPWDILTSDVRKCVPENCGFFFIDGQKSQYGNFVKKLQEIKQENSIWIIDDVIKFRNKLDSLYEYLDEMQIQYKIVPTEPDDGVMILS